MNTKILGHTLRCILLCFTLLLTGCASVVTPNYSQSLSELRKGAYTLDPDHAYLIFRIEHLGLSTVVGRFNTVDASLDFNPDAISELSLEGSVDVGSIDMNNDDLEERLRGSGWLDTTRYPEARFTSLSVAPVGEDAESISGNTFILNGEFTLRGITKPVSLLATFKGGADNLLTGLYTLGFTASGSISRSDYGIDAFAALVADEVFIEIHAEFQRTQS